MNIEHIEESKRISLTLLSTHPKKYNQFQERPSQLQFLL